MYEANINVKAIDSYKLLADQNFMIQPRRHGLYYHDEHIQVFIPGIDREETVFVPRTDKVIAMRLEAVPLGFQVPHPLRLSSEEGTLTAREGVEQGFPTTKHRSKEGDLELTRDLRPRGKPPGSLVKIPCQTRPTRVLPGRRRTKEKPGERKDRAVVNPTPGQYHQRTFPVHQHHFQHTQHQLQHQPNCGY